MPSPKSEISSPGVYLIYCHANGKAYVGSSGRVCARLAHHRCDLRYNRHGNKHLQNAWNLYGEGEFSMGMLQVCALVDRLVVEQQWLDLWYCSGYAFNRHPRAESPVGNKWTEAEKAAKSRAMKNNPSFKGRHHTESAKKLLSEHGKERYKDPRSAPFFGKKHTDEAKAKISAANAGNKYCVGRRLSDETRAEMSRVRSGRSVSDATKAKISAFMRSDKNPHKGKTRSPETKEAIKRAAAAMTPEQKAARSAKISAALKALPPKTDEQKAARAEKVKQTLARKRATVSAGTLQKSL